MHLAWKWQICCSNTVKLFVCFKGRLSPLPDWRIDICQLSHVIQKATTSYFTNGDYLWVVGEDAADLKMTTLLFNYRKVGCLFVSRVGFRHCLINLSILPVKSRDSKGNNIRFYKWWLPMSSGRECSCRLDCMLAWMESYYPKLAWSLARYIYVWLWKTISVGWSELLKNTWKVI